jgi:hypothetical protein
VLAGEINLLCKLLKLSPTEEARNLSQALSIRGSSIQCLGNWRRVLAGRLLEWIILESIGRDSEKRAVFSVSNVSAIGAPVGNFHAITVSAKRSKNAAWLDGEPRSAIDTNLESDVIARELATCLPTVSVISRLSL